MTEKKLGFADLLFLRDQRELKRDFHAAIRGYMDSTVPNLPDALKAHASRHKFYIDMDELSSYVQKLCIANNPERAHKLINKGVSDYEWRLWVKVSVFFPLRLVKKLFWPIAAVLIGLTIYHYLIVT